MRMKLATLQAALIIGVLASQAHAVELSLSKASSIEAAPAGTVERMEMAPLEGYPIEPSRPRPKLTSEISNPRQVEGARRPIKAPVPESNPARVSFCPSEVF